MSAFVESGEGGIRTLGTGEPHTRFPVVHLQPLGHLSGGLGKDSVFYMNRSFEWVALWYAAERLCKGA